VVMLTVTPVSRRMHKKTRSLILRFYSPLAYSVIQRKPAFYLTTFVLPSFIITTLAIIGIFSPFNDSGGREEKVTMGLTTLLTMAVILLIITDQMPKSSERMPLLGITYTKPQLEPKPEPKHEQRMCCVMVQYPVA
jgi:uncharacterized membrane protein